jgi:superfamily II DNA/RNA helicase
VRIFAPVDHFRLTKRVVSHVNSLLEMGHRETIDRLMTYLPPLEERIQNFSFSETLTPEVIALADAYLRPGYAVVDGSQHALQTDWAVNHTHVIMPDERWVTGTIDILLNIINDEKYKHKKGIFLFRRRSYTTVCWRQWG